MLNISRSSQFRKFVKNAKQTSVTTFITTSVTNPKSCLPDIIRQQRWFDQCFRLEECSSGRGSSGNGQCKYPMCDTSHDHQSCILCRSCVFNFVRNIQAKASKGNVVQVGAKGTSSEKRWW